MIPICGDKTKRSEGNALTPTPVEKRSEMGLRIADQVPITEQLRVLRMLEPMTAELSFENYLAVAMESLGIQEDIEGKSDNLNRPEFQKKNVDDQDVMSSYIELCRRMMLKAETAEVARRRVKVMSMRLSLPDDIVKQPAVAIITKVLHLLRKLAVEYEIPLEVPTSCQSIILYFIARKGRGILRSTYADWYRQVSADSKNGYVEATKIDFVPESALTYADNFTFCVIYNFQHDSVPVFSQFRDFPVAVPSDMVTVWRLCVTSANYNVSDENGDIIFTFSDGFTPSEFTVTYALPGFLDDVSSLTQRFLLQPNTDLLRILDSLSVNIVPSAPSTGISVFHQVTLELGIPRSVTPVAPPQEVVIVNSTPLWTSNYSAGPPESYQDPLPKVQYREDKAAIYYRRDGTEHAPVYYGQTSVQGKTIYAKATSKREVQASLRAQVVTIVGPTKITWVETSSIREWEAALHNKNMHTLNGNTLKFSKQALAKMARSLEIDGEPTLPQAVKSDPVTVPPPASESAILEELKLRQQHHPPPLPKDEDNLEKKTAVLDIVNNEVSDRYVSWSELYDILESRMNDVSIRVDGYVCMMYFFAYESKLDEEWAQRLLEQVSALGRDYSIDVPDERELTPVKDDFRVEAKGAKKRPSDSGPPLERGQKRPPGRQPDDPAKKERENKTLQDWLHQFDSVKRRVIQSIPTDWRAITYLTTSTHSKEFKQKIWSELDIIDEIRDAGWLYLASPHPIVYHDVLLGRRVAMLLPEGKALEDRTIEIFGTVLPTSELNRVRAEEAAKHNKLMHALNGNTTWPEVKVMSDVKTKMASPPEGGRPYDPLDLLSQFRSNAGVFSPDLIDFTSGYTFTAHVNALGVAGAVQQTIDVPIYYMTVEDPAAPLQTPGTISYTHVVDADVGEPLIESALGTEVTSVILKGNQSINKADARSFNGFYLSDLAQIQHIAPNYDLGLEQMVLKWIMLYDWLAHQGISTQWIPKTVSPFSPDIVPQSPVSVGLSNFATANYNVAAGGGSLLHPVTNLPGSVSFHVCSQTLPSNEPYWVFPQALLGHPNKQAAMAIFIALIAEWPFQALSVTHQVAGPVNVRCFHPSGRTYVPGETQINVLMPTKTASRPPTAQNDANNIVTFRPIAGATAAGALAAGQMFDVNFIGQAPPLPPITTYPLVDYLTSWFTPSPYCARATDVIQYMRILQTICNVNNTIEAMMHVWTALAMKLLPLQRVPLGGVIVPLTVPPVLAEFSWNNVMGRDIPIYDTTPATFRIDNINNTIRAMMAVARTQFSSWNAIATGLYTVKQTDAGKQLPCRIATPYYYIYKHGLGILTGMASHMYWRTFGLSSSDLGGIFLIQSPESYRHDVLQTFWDGTLQSRKMVPTYASASFESIFTNCLKYKVPCVNNGICDLTVFDRLMYDEFPWATTYAVPLNPTGGVMVTLFCDAQIAYLARDTLDYALPPTYVNGQGTYGFDLPCKLEMGPGLLPPVDAQISKYFDTAYTRWIYDGKTIHNMKIVKWMGYQGLLNQVPPGMRIFFPASGQNIAQNNTPFPMNTIFNAGWMGSYAATAFVDSTGRYGIYYNNDVTDQRTIRTACLEVAAVPLTTLRYTGGTILIADYREGQRAVTSALRPRKTIVGKEKTPDSQVPGSEKGADPQ